MSKEAIAAAQRFNEAAPPAQTALNRALVFAVARGQAEKAAALLKEGANPDWCGSRYKKSLLQVAALHGHKDVVLTLLDAGANPNIQDTIGRTALFETLRNDALDIARLLLEAKADPNLRMKSGLSPAAWPVIRNHCGMIDQLLACGLDLTARDEEDRTLLFRAGLRNLSAMRKLLAAGAKIDDVNNLKQTPLAHCADNQLVRHMLLLIRKGSAVDTRDYEGNTPLNRASRWGHIRAVKVLLRHGAHTDAPNDEGVTPMQSAVLRLEQVKQFPAAQKYTEELAAAQAVLSALEAAHEKNLVCPFREGTNRAIFAMKSLQLKMKA
ncbi:MAG: ankyrin repeat domain-containing protein [Alphaproteobacteria bacterium]